MEELQNLTPLYNKEFYLAYLCGEDVALPTPDGNTEHYLAYLCGMDVPIPDPLYTKEFYLAYKCGMDVELPEPGPYRIDQYLAKWCGMDVEVPEPMYRIEYWLAQLANSGELKTVSGNPISVSDALARPAESLVIEILPQQSGSGDPSPDNVRPISGFTVCNVQRTGKNLLDIATNYIEQGTLSSSNGQEGPSTVRIRTHGYIRFFAGQEFSVSAIGSATKYYAHYYDAEYGYVGNSNGWINLGSSATTPNGTVYMRLVFGTATDNYIQPTDISDIQLELGSTASDFAPYTGTTYAIDWTSEGTVYGGELDVTTGVLTVDSALEVFDIIMPNGNIISNIGLDSIGTSGSVVDLGDVVRVTFSVGNTSANYALVSSAYASKMCNMAKHYFAYNDTSVHWYRNTMLYLFLPKSVCGSTVTEVRDYLISIKDTNPLSLWIPLATPQTIQLTPTEIQMLLGDNTIWNDVGDMTLEYLADGPADDIDALQILLGNRYVNNGGEDEATDREALEILLGGNTR